MTNPDTFSTIAAAAGVIAVLTKIVASQRAHLKRLDEQNKELKLQHQELKARLGEAARLQSEAIRAGITAESMTPDYSYGHKFAPVEAAIRKCMNAFGRLMVEISVAYPNEIALAEVHRRCAQRIRDIAAELTRSHDEQVEVPLTCGYIGGYSNMLDLLNKNLLGPVADLRQQKADEGKVKEQTVSSLLRLADLLESDAKKIEKIELG